MVNAYINAQQYATRLAMDLCKIELMEFFTKIHDQFYPDVDIAFMETFIDMLKHTNEFVVNGEMLRKYGVMTSTESSDIRKKLESLGLNEGENYLVGDVSEQLKSGTKHKKEYYLTPAAFKKCLMRAQRRANQPVDPVIYIDYYLLLEAIFDLYRTYQTLYSEKLLSMKDDKIDQLTGEVKDLKTDIKELLGLAKQQGVKIDEQTSMISELHEKVDGIFDFMASLARFALPMWNGASVFKTQLNHLQEDSKNLPDALKHLKVMYTVAFYEFEEDHANVIIYFCCTNFKQMRGRIVNLYERHVEDTDEPMIMLKPKAICLISQEINCERSSLAQLDFNAPARYDKRFKSFNVRYETTKHKEVRTNYNLIVDNARKEDLQGYQMRRSKIVEDESHCINQDIIEHMAETDKHFFAETLPYCSEFINYQTIKINKKKLSLGFKPRGRSSLKKLTSNKFDYDDLDMRLTKTMYPLHKINDILIKDSGVNQVDLMIEDGIISKSNIKSLFRTAKAAAKAEDLKFDEKTQKQVDAINEDDLPDTDNEDM